MPKVPFTFKTLCLGLLLTSITYGKTQPNYRVIAYKDDTTSLSGHYFTTQTPHNPSKRWLLLFPDWMGMTDVADQYAQKWTQEGYSVFVADIYGPNQTPKSREEAAKLSSFYKANRGIMRSRATAALGALHQIKNVDSLHIASIGYCFGGTCALELARSGAKLCGTISLHGGLDTPTPEDAKNIQGKVLVLHGGNDPFVPQEQVLNFMDEMKAAQVDWQLVQFGGAVHGFSNPSAPLDANQGYAFNPLAEKRSTEIIRLFSKEIFTPFANPKKP